jgi:hypothetical protein
LTPKKIRKKGKKIRKKVRALIRALIVSNIKKEGFIFVSGSQSESESNSGLLPASMAKFQSD